MSAIFKVMKVDPEGSGLDWSNHEGIIITDAKRCCPRCTVIFGTAPGGHEMGPFVRGELEPVNNEAETIVAEIATFLTK